jgi:hypothetical protein
MAPAVYSAAIGNIARELPMDAWLVVHASAGRTVAAVRTIWPFGFYRCRINDLDQRSKQ